MGRSGRNKPSAQIPTEVGQLWPPLCNSAANENLRILWRVEEYSYQRGHYIPMDFY